MKNERFTQVLKFLVSKKPDRNSILENLMIKDENKLNRDNGLFHATEEDLPEIIKIYSSRNRWLKEKGKLYFYGRGVRRNYQKSIRNHEDRLYVWKENGKVEAFAMFDDKDDEHIWDDYPIKGLKAMYITDLFSNMHSESQNAGYKLISAIEELARQHGYDVTRGTVVNDNKVLLDYYNNLHTMEFCGEKELNGQTHTLLQHHLQPDSHYLSKQKRSLNETNINQTSDKSTSSLHRKSVDLLIQFEDKGAAAYCKSLNNDEPLTIQRASEIEDFSDANYRLHREVEYFSEFRYFTKMTCIGRGSKYESGWTGKRGFFSWEKLKKLSLPTSVTRIGDSAFYKDWNLEEIDFCDGVSYEIGDMTHIQDTKWFINKQSLGETLIYFGQTAALVTQKVIDELKFRKDTICINPNLLKGAECVVNFYVPDYFYKHESRKEEFLTFIHKCPEIQNFIFENDKDSLYVFDDGVLYTKDKKELLYVSSKVQNLKFVMPKEVETLHHRSFKLSRFTEIEINDTLEEIPEKIFCYNTDLEKVVLGKNIRKVGAESFAMSGISEIKLNDGLKEIDKLAFTDCVELTKVEIPDSVEVLGRGAFQECKKLESVSLGKSLKTIEPLCFKESPLKEINFDNCPDLQKIGYEAFVKTSFEKIDLSKNTSLTELGAVFCDIAPLTEVILPDTIKKLSATFKYDRISSKLEKINFPSSLEELEDVPFGGCYNLRLEFDTFPTQLKKFIRESGKGQAYKYYDYSNLNNIHIKTLVTDPSIKTITNLMYSGCRIDTLIVSEGTRVLDTDAFARCNIKKVYLPKSIEFISSDALGLYRNVQTENVLERAEVYIPDTPKLIDMQPNIIDNWETIVYVPEKKLKNYSSSQKYKKAFAGRAEFRVWDGNVQQREEITDKKLIGSSKFKFGFAERIFDYRSSSIDSICNKSYWGFGQSFSSYRGYYIDEYRKYLMNGEQGEFVVKPIPEWALENEWSEDSLIPKYKFCRYSYYQAIPAESLPVSKNETEIYNELRKIKKKKSDILKYIETVFDGEKVCKCFFFDDEEIGIDAYYPSDDKHFVFRLQFNGKPSEHFEDSFIDKISQEVVKKYKKEDDKFLKNFFKDLKSQTQKIKKIYLKKQKQTVQEKFKFNFDSKLFEEIGNQLQNINTSRIKDKSLDPLNWDAPIESWEEMRQRTVDYLTFKGVKSVPSFFGKYKNAKNEGWDFVFDPEDNHPEQNYVEFTPYIKEMGCNSIFPFDLVEFFITAQYNERTDSNDIFSIDFKTLNGNHDWNFDFKTNKVHEIKNVHHWSHPINVEGFRIVRKFIDTILDKFKLKWVEFFKDTEYFSKSMNHQDLEPLIDQFWDKFDFSFGGLNETIDNQLSNTSVSDIAKQSLKISFETFKMMLANKMEGERIRLISQPFEITDEWGCEAKYYLEDDLVVYETKGNDKYILTHVRNIGAKGKLFYVGRTLVSPARRKKTYVSYFSETTTELEKFYVNSFEGFSILVRHLFPTINPESILPPQTNESTPNQISSKKISDVKSDGTDVLKFELFKNKLRKVIPCERNASRNDFVNGIINYLEWDYAFAKGTKRNVTNSFPELKISEHIFINDEHYGPLTAQSIIWRPDKKDEPDEFEIMWYQYLTHEQDPNWVEEGYFTVEECMTSTPFDSLEANLKNEIYNHRKKVVDEEYHKWQNGQIISHTRLQESVPSQISGTGLENIEKRSEDDAFYSSPERIFDILASKYNRQRLETTPDIIWPVLQMLGRLGERPSNVQAFTFYSLDFNEINNKEKTNFGLFEVYTVYILEMNGEILVAIQDGDMGEASSITLIGNYPKIYYRNFYEDFCRFMDEFDSTCNQVIKEFMENISYSDFHGPDEVDIENLSYSDLLENDFDVDFWNRIVQISRTYFHIYR